MSGGSYEIEIKSLLGSRENAEKLESRMKEIDPKLQEMGSHSQLNHYFEGKGDWDKVSRTLSSREDQLSFVELAKKAKDFSLRTRNADGKVLLVLKAAIDDTTSANGTARREFEKEVRMSLDELDRAILDAGFTYQAKWSRDRKEYKYKGVNVTIDKNAGYGYLAEFEAIETDPSMADSTKAMLRQVMDEVGAKELDQKRLERMFAYYNQNWRDYYGTEKIFVIE